MDCLALVGYFELLMKEWCLGCWPLLQDWLNTRWTSGWPETCSWWLRSESRTDLLKTGFPLYLKDTARVIQSGDSLGWQSLRVSQGSTFVGPAWAGWSLREAHVCWQLLQALKTLPVKRKDRISEDCTRENRAQTVSKKNPKRRV